MGADAIAYLVIGLLALIGGGASLIYFERKYIKDRLEKKYSKKQLLMFFGLDAVIATGLTFLMAALFTGNSAWATQGEWLAGPYKGNALNYVANFSFALIGVWIFGFTSAALWSNFALRFWKSDLEEKSLKLVKVFLYGSIPLAVFSFLLWSDNIAPYLTYPLFNGFSIDGNGFRFTKPGESGGFHIAFYALAILSGVAIAYWVSDHRFYQKYKKHGILDTLVLVAFPAGVLGARIWYVVGNWDREFAGFPFTKVFEIWNGGLTILGGAAAGVLVGYFFLRATKKFVDMRFAIDAIVPTVLLAQAMGRFGNFFNLEVYGQVVEYTNGWSWLPSWLLTNMSFSNGGSALPTGQINVPLFLVEALFNVAGYFLITYGIGKGLKKYAKPGDCCGAYFLWYGLVRIIMEPMRNSNFNMGTDNAWSICNSLAYILIGLALIAAFHMADAYKENKKSLHFPIIGLSLLLPAFFFPFLPSINVSTAKDGTGTTNVFSGFEIIFGRSVFYLISYIILILAFVSFAVCLLLKILKKDKDWIVALIGIAFSLLSGIFFFAGKKTAYLGNIGESFVNLSYGFVLVALFALVAALLVAIPYITGFINKKNAKREEKGVSQLAKEENEQEAKKI